MYQRPIQLQKGFKEEVQLQFKNSDQKPVSISSSSYKLDVIDIAGRQLMFTKDVTILETISTTSNITNKGLASVVFDPYDTISLAAGSYKFVVKKDNLDNTFSPTYANTYYGITGDLEVLESGFPIGFETQTVDFEMLERNKDYDRTVGDMGFIFTTGWMKPNLRMSTYNTTTSLVITLSSFKGRIMVLGTMDNNPSGTLHANNQEFSITNWSTDTQTTSIIELDCGSGYTAIKVKIKPDLTTMGTNYYPTGWPVGSQTNKFPNGFVDQIQYFS